MHTSGLGILNSVGYLAMLYLVAVAASTVLGSIQQWAKSQRATAIVHPWAVVLWLLVAVPSLYEFAHHPIYDRLSRQPDRIKHHHEYYRLITSVTVQDGGVRGTAFNLIVLAGVLILAVRFWGAVRTTLIAIVGAVAFNLSAVYLSASAGGGNSGMTFFLATSIVGLLLVRRPSWPVVAAALGIVTIGVVLLVTRDAHGEAILAGLLVGGPLTASLLGPRRVGEPARAVPRPAGGHPALYRR